MRGSDPDATLYWLARMVYAGEDPRFLFRRMLIFASEDVGLADERALQVVIAAAESFDRIGLPEGRFPLAHAALYLATAPQEQLHYGFLRRPRGRRKRARRRGPHPPQGRQPRQRGLWPRRGLSLPPRLPRALGRPAVPTRRFAGPHLLPSPRTKAAKRKRATASANAASSNSPPCAKQSPPRPRYCPCPHPTKRATNGSSAPAVTLAPN